MWTHFHLLPLLQISVLSACKIASNCWGRRWPILEHQPKAAMSCRLLTDWHPDNPDPSTVASSVHKICKWVCHQCAHVWSTRPNDRDARGSGCPQCSNKRKGIGKLPLFAVSHPELAAEWVPHPDLKPIHSLTAGSGEMGNWQCPLCKGFYQAMVCNRTRGSGCQKPSCLLVRRLSSETLERRRRLPWQ